MANWLVYFADVSSKPKESHIDFQKINFRKIENSFEDLLKILMSSFRSWLLNLGNPSRSDPVPHT